MSRRVGLTTTVSSLLLFSSAGALGAADGPATCVGIGASITPSTVGGIPEVLAVVRGIYSEVSPGPAPA